MGEIKTCRTCVHALKAVFINEKYENKNIEGWGRCNTIRSIPSIEYLQDNAEKLKKTAYIIQSDDFKDEGFLFSDLYFEIDKFGCLNHKTKNEPNKIPRTTPTRINQKLCREPGFKSNRE